VAQYRVREGDLHQPVVYAAVVTVTAAALLLLPTVLVCLILLHTSVREKQDYSKLLMLS
jgi:hypothetical protein